jgi:predicted outer membrane protein
MKTVLLNGVILVCLTWTAAAHAQDGFADPAGANAWDRKFVRETSENSRIEQQLGRLAQHRSQNERVKERAQKMASDYAQFTEELTNMPVAVPFLPKSYDKSTRAVETFSGLSTKEFDHNALQELNRYNQETIRLCDRESMRGENSLLKQFALAELPILQSDLDQGQSLFAQMNNKTHEPSEDVVPGATTTQTTQSNP